MQIPILNYIDRIHLHLGRFQPHTNCFWSHLFWHSKIRHPSILLRSYLLLTLGTQQFDSLSQPVLSVHGNIRIEQHPCQKETQTLGNWGIVFDALCCSAEIRAGRVRFFALPCWAAGPASLDMIFISAGRWSIVILFLTYWQQHEHKRIPNEVNVQLMIEKHLKKQYDNINVGIGWLIDKVYHCTFYAKLQKEAYTELCWNFLAPLQPYRTYYCFRVKLFSCCKYPI